MVLKHKHAEGHYVWREDENTYCMHYDRRVNHAGFAPSYFATLQTTFSHSLESLANVYINANQPRVANLQRAFGFTWPTDFLYK